MSSQSEYSKYVGHNIQIRRLNMGLKQWQLGNQVGYSSSTVSRNEKGDGLSTDVIEAYAHALGCSIDDLVAGFENGPVPIDKCDDEYDAVVGNAKLLPVEIKSQIALMIKSALAIHRYTTT